MKLIRVFVPILLALCYYWRTINCESRYDIYIDYMEFPFGKNDSKMKRGTLRVKKYNRTTFGVDGGIELLQPITDDINVLATAHYKQFSGNQYIKIGDIKLKNFCSFLKTDKTFYPKLAKNVGAPLGDKLECPSPGIPAGNYIFRDYIIEEDGFLPDFIRYDDWFINLRFRYKTITIGGIDKWVVIKRKEHLVIKGL